jgi:hypothetical protein
VSVIHVVECLQLFRKGTFLTYVKKDGGDKCQIKEVRNKTFITVYGILFRRYFYFVFLSHTTSLVCI